MRKLLAMLVIITAFGVACTKHYSAVNTDLGVDPLISILLSYEDYRARANAALALGKIGYGRAVDPLIISLRDEYAEVRGSSAWALGEIEDNRAVEPLLPLLNDKYDPVRINTARALGKIKDNRAILPLIHALDDKNIDVIVESAQALKNFNDPRTIIPLSLLLKHRDESVRIAAINALSNSENTQAVPPLILSLGDKSVTVRINVIRALGALESNKATIPLLKHYRSNGIEQMEQEEIINALKKLKYAHWKNDGTPYRIISRNGQLVEYDDGTWQDTNSGLMCCGPAHISNIEWDQLRNNIQIALNKCTAGGYKDWRTPSRDELDIFSPYLDLVTKKVKDKKNSKKTDKCFWFEAVHNQRYDAVSYDAFCPNTGDPNKDDQLFLLVPVRSED